MLCYGQWVAAPVPCYIAGAAWWGSPVGSEDEEKPLRTQAGAPGTQGRHEISNTATLYYYYPRNKWQLIK